MNIFTYTNYLKIVFLFCFLSFIRSSMLGQSCIGCAQVRDSSSYWTAETYRDAYYGAWPTSSWTYKDGCYSTGNTSMDTFQLINPSIQNVCPLGWNNSRQGFIFTRRINVTPGLYQLTINFIGVAAIELNNKTQYANYTLPYFNGTNRSKTLTLNLSGDYFFLLKYAPDNVGGLYFKFKLTKLSSTISSPVEEPLTTSSVSKWYVSTRMDVNSANQFIGYYIQNATSTTDQGLNSTGILGINQNPSSLANSTWIGPTTSTYTNASSYRLTAKRSGFPCGWYKVVLLSNKDTIQVKKSGVVILQRNTASSEVLSSSKIYLDRTTSIEIYLSVINGNGNYNVQIIPEYNQINSSSLTSTCQTSLQSGVHHFSSSTGDYIGSIQSNGSDLGLVTIGSYVESTQVTIPANYIDSINGGIALNRHFMIQTTNLPTTPITIWLPFSNTELYPITMDTNLIIDANPTVTSFSHNSLANSNIADNNSILTDLSSAYTNNVAISVNPSIRTRKVTFLPTALSTEIWLLQGNLLALGTEELNIAFICDDQKIIITGNLDDSTYQKTLIELSVDGITWLSNLENDPSDPDSVIDIPQKIAGMPFYYVRIHRFNKDGILVHEEIKTVVCKNPSLDMAYPNPFSSLIILPSESIERVKILDINGSEIFFDVQRSNGKTEIFLEQNLSNGVYTLIYFFQDHLKIQKLIKL